MPHAKESSEALVTIATGKLHADLSDCRRRVEALVKGLTADQLTRRPEPDKWSIAECVAHLNVTARVVQPLMARAIAHGKKREVFAQGPFKWGVRGRLLVWIAEPPPKFRMRAPKAVVPPASVGDPSQLLASFLKTQDEWERLWREAQGLDMARINVAPRLSLFRCRLSASFPWMMAHQRRHLLQAEKVKQQILSGASSSSAQAG